jgi:hypothetical protein
MSCKAIGVTAAPPEQMHLLLTRRRSPMISLLWLMKTLVGYTN